MDFSPFEFLYCLNFKIQVFLLLILSNELTKSLEALLEISDRDLRKLLGVCKLGPQLGQNPEVPKKKGKLKDRIVHSTLLGKIGPALLALGLVQQGHQAGVGHQEFWSVPWAG